MKTFLIGVVMSFQVVQISDCHLFSDAQTRLKGVPTMDTFHRVMSVIHQEFPDADRYIFTGDLTHLSLIHI